MTPPESMTAPRTVEPGGWTKGPWHLGGNDGLIVYAADGFAVCNAITFHGTFKEGQSEANARLIAAAPALYEALEKLLDHYTALVNCGDCGNWDPETETEVIAARAALLLSRGEMVK